MSRLIVLAGVLLLFSQPLAPVQAGGEISFGQTEVENSFPNEITFEVQVSSTAGDIQTAKFYYALRGDASVSQAIIAVEPAERVTLRFTRDTSRQTIPPGAPILFHWQAVDSAGNRISSSEESTHYDDVRYEWDVLADEAVAVWWHDRPDEVGREVFDVAQRALREQRKLFGAGLEYQIRIIIYNDQAEFAGWHSYVGEFVGGQAFSRLGITTQIVPVSGSQSFWLNDVIPHEISHLYFHQVTDHPLSSPPLWLNEGVAQYNEYRDHERDLEVVREVILAGDLIPLYAIVGSFGYQEEQVALSYAESLSAVTYLIEQYGTDGLSALLAAYRDGCSDEKAFSTALGRTAAEFEADWLTWLGVPEGTYLPPTPWPTLAPLSAPAAGIDATAEPTHVTPTASPTTTLSESKPREGMHFTFDCCLCPTTVLPALLLALGCVLPAGVRRWR